MISVYTLHSTLFDSPFFFFTIPCPPRSTLFPYTTLFRSQGQPNWMTKGRGFTTVGLYAALIQIVLLYWVINLDRKSTRLNSSHVRISYAVFCLKKKNKIARTNSYNFYRFARNLASHQQMT